YEMAKFIKNAKKKTPVKVYLKGNLAEIDFSTVKFFGDTKQGVVFGDLEEVNPILEMNRNLIEDYVMETDRRLSAVPLLDITKVNARIEPGVSIREYVQIGDQAVIMMGAIINIGAEIGSKTMIDMNVVIGARVK